MNHILSFDQLFERLQMSTNNWSIISNESSFDKKDENGYLVFSKDGTFSVIYKKKEEESRIEFYMDKEYSSDKKSVCECKIVTKSGSDRIKKGFSDINQENVWEIVSTFFDYSDLEKSEKNIVDRFLMGFSKSIKDVQDTDESDQLPPSFNIFYKFIKSSVKNPGEIPEVDTDNYNFSDIINKFISYLKGDKKY